MQWSKASRAPCPETFNMVGAALLKAPEASGIASTSSAHPFQAIKLCCGLQEPPFATHFEWSSLQLPGLICRAR